jgi:hypothetical protein
MSRAWLAVWGMRPICRAANFGAVQHEQAVMTGATDVPFLSRFRNPGLASRTVVSPPRIVCIDFLSRLTCGVMSRAGISLRRSVPTSA